MPFIQIHYLLKANIKKLGWWPDLLSSGSPVNGLLRPAEQPSDEGYPGAVEEVG